MKKKSKNHISAEIHTAEVDTGKRDGRLLSSPSPQCFTAAAVFALAGSKKKKKKAPLFCRVPISRRQQELSFRGKLVPETPGTLLQ